MHMFRTRFSTPKQLPHEAPEELLRACSSQSKLLCCSVGLKDPSKHQNLPVRESPGWITRWVNHSSVQQVWGSFLLPVSPASPQQEGCVAHVKLEVHAGYPYSTAITGAIEQGALCKYTHRVKAQGRRRRHPPLLKQTKRPAKVVVQTQGKQPADTT